MSIEPNASDLNFHVLTTLLVKGTRDLVGAGTPGECSMVLSGPNFYPEGVISVTLRQPDGKLFKAEAIRPSDCLFFVAVAGYRIERLEIKAPGSEHVGGFAGAALLAPGEPGQRFKLFHLLARDIRESVRNPGQSKSSEVARLTAGSPANPDFKRKKRYLKDIGEPWASFTGIAQVFASDSLEALNGLDGGAPLQAALVCEGERVIDQLPTPRPHYEMIEQALNPARIWAIGNAAMREVEREIGTGIASPRALGNTTAPSSDQQPENFDQFASDPFRTSGHRTFLRWIYSELFTTKSPQQFTSLEDPPAPAPDRLARGISLEGLIENSAEVEGILSGDDGWSALLRTAGLSQQEQAVWNLLYTRSESEIKEALGLRDLGQPISRGRKKLIAFCRPILSPGAASN